MKVKTTVKASSGKQTGRRIHDTVKVIKFVDKATPL
jgi:type VI protein secretion system component Hcp